MKTVKPPRSTPEMKLAVALAKQKAFADKVASLKKAVTEKAEADIRSLQIKIGKLAEEFGILTLPDSVLRKAFGEIAKSNGAKPLPAIPAVEVNVPATPEAVKPTESVYVAPAPAPAPAPAAPQKVEEVKKGGMFSR